MASNAAPESLSFNPFIISKNINDQDPDLKIFDESVSSYLNTDYVLPKHVSFSVSFKNISKTVYLFHI